MNYAFNKGVFEEVNSTPITPEHIAHEVVRLLNDTDFWKEPYADTCSITDYIETHRVLDIYCKSASFLVVFYERFMFSLRYVLPNPDDRDYFIWRYLLYAFCPSRVIRDQVCNYCYRNEKYDMSSTYGNIYAFDIREDMGVDSVDARKVVEDLKFDVVVGNPPYNNDAYIDFVQLGNKLSKSYSLWITPAKFWAKSTCDNDEKFRSMVKGSGDSFVVYKNCKDIFDISEPGGIAYYLLGRDNKDSKYRIKCIHKNSVAFQSDFEKHDSLDFLPLSTLNILNKFGKSNFKNTLGLRQSFYVKNTETGMSEANLGVDIYSGKNLCGSISADELFTTDNLDKYKCIQNCICGSGSFQADNTGAFLGMPPIYILKPNEVGKGSFHHLRFFDTNSEATHFVEFMNTKLVNFAYTCGLCGTTNSAEFYRYIPDPGSFDRIFEDKPLMGYVPDENGEYIDSDGNKHCSLYAKYKLTDKEIDIIESVIRERK